MGNLFAQILKEAVDDLETKPEAPEESDDLFADEETEKDPAEGEGETEDEETEDNSTQKQLQDICYSILDALEQEALASGEEIGDDSPDIAIELLIKIAPSLPDEQAKLCIDTLSEYYEMEVEEDGEGEDDFFEPQTKADGSEYEEDEEAVKTESLKKKV